MSGRQQFPGRFFPENICLAAVGEKISRVGLAKSELLNLQVIRNIHFILKVCNQHLGVQLMRFPNLSELFF